MSYDVEIIEYDRGEYPETCRCNLCDREFVYSREQRTTKNTCRTCLINRHRFKLKAYMIDYKGGLCQLCGYNECHRSLDFHHVDPAQKVSNLGGKHCVGWDTLRSELDKCVLLCRNCHGEVEDAVELEKWGHRLPILDTVDRVHGLWVPPLGFDSFTRIGWEAYHPRFKAERLYLEELSAAAEEVIRCLELVDGPPQK